MGCYPRRHPDQVASPGTRPTAARRACLDRSSEEPHDGPSQRSPGCGYSTDYADATDRERHSPASQAAGYGAEEPVHQKDQYATMLQDMQDIQNEGQQKLKELSDKYMTAVNQTPHPEALKKEASEEAPMVDHDLMPMKTYIHTDRHAYIQTCIHAYMHTYMHKYIHIHTYVHTYSQPARQAGRQADRRRQTHRRTGTQTHIHACMHTYVHAYIHTYMHTYIHTRIHCEWGWETEDLQKWHRPETHSRILHGGSLRDSSLLGPDNRDRLASKAHRQHLVSVVRGLDSTVYRQQFKKL